MLLRAWRRRAGRRYEHRGRDFRRCWRWGRWWAGRATAVPTTAGVPPGDAAAATAAADIAHAAALTGSLPLERLCSSSSSAAIPSSSCGAGTGACTRRRKRARSSRVHETVVEEPARRGGGPGANPPAVLFLPAVPRHWHRHRSRRDRPRRVRRAATAVTTTTTTVAAAAAYCGSRRGLARRAARSVVGPKAPSRRGSRLLWLRLLRARGREHHAVVGLGWGWFARWAWQEARERSGDSTGARYCHGKVVVVVRLTRLSIADLERQGWRCELSGKSLARQARTSCL